MLERQTDLWKWFSDLEFAIIALTNKQEAETKTEQSQTQSIGPQSGYLQKVLEELNAVIIAPDSDSTTAAVKLDNGEGSL